jgi:adenylate cyclase
MVKKFSGLILYLLITIFVITIYLDQPVALGKWEMAVYDKLFQLRGKKDVQDDIQIIGIDDISVQMVGRWPWHRNRLAELVDKIAKQSPKVICLDVPFAEDPREDSLGYTALLAKEIKKAGNVVLPYRYSVADFSATGFTLPDYIHKTTFVNFNDREKLENSTTLSATSIFPPPPALAEAAHGLGFAGVSFDPDRYIRTEPMLLKYAGEFLPSIPVAVSSCYFGLTRDALKVHIEKSIEMPPRVIPIDDLGRMRINFNGPPGVFKYISASEILNETIGKRELSGKIVLIAYTAAGTVDLYSTPVAQSIHGVEITANSIENIVHNNFLKGLDESGLINLLMILCIGMF